MRIEQLVVALLDNAIKYSPQGGAVDVSLERAAAEYVLSVRDRGIGIPEAELPLVTRQYHRAANASENHYPGVGLGLTICRAIVEQHGGRLEIASELGDGTQVKAHLPIGNGNEAHPNR